MIMQQRLKSAISLHSVFAILALCTTVPYVRPAGSLCTLWAIERNARLQVVKSRLL